MRKYLAVAVMLFVFVIAWAPPTAVAETDNPAIAIAEAIKESASRLSVARAATYTEEAETRESLVAKAAALEQEAGLYKTTAKMRQTLEDNPISVKYLGEEKRLGGNFHVTEYTYLPRDKKAHAVLAIKAATADAELGFVNLRLSRLAEKESCLAGNARCDSSIAESGRKNKEAQESLFKALNVMRMSVP